MNPCFSMIAVNAMFNRLNVFFGYVIAVIVLISFAPVSMAEDGVPKLVYLLAEEDKLIASNIKFNRFDEMKLQAKEKVLEHAVGNAVIVVVTNKRIIGYSVYTASWRSRDIGADEEVNNIAAEDYSALVQTSKRFLSFNGKNGVWAETQRSKIFQ
jgi:hypothetical protein